VVGVGAAAEVVVAGVAAEGVVPVFAVGEVGAAVAAEQVRAGAGTARKWLSRPSPPVTTSSSSPALRRSGPSPPRIVSRPAWVQRVMGRVNDAAEVGTDHDEVVTALGIDDDSRDGVGGEWVNGVVELDRRGWRRHFPAEDDVVVLGAAFDEQYAVGDGVAGVEESAGFEGIEHQVKRWKESAPRNR
jgi:hypothetical protein